ncbi:MAG: hypothetical protein RL380_1833, partial [Verrucomicrobiota bacterium]
PTNDVVITSILAGSQGFVKRGTGTLTVEAVNTLTGPVQIDEGVIKFGNATAFGPVATSKIIFNGGALRLGTNAFAVPTIAPAMNYSNIVLTTGTIIASNGNYDVYNSVLYGTNASLNLRAAGRFTSTATLTNFSGTIDLTGTTGSGVWRINLGSGSPAYDLSKITLNLGTTSGRTQTRMTGFAGIVNLGALAGGTGCTLLGSDQTSSLSTWSIGGLNTSTTFDGRMRDNTSVRQIAFTKVGTGTLTLSAVNDYTGVTVISNGIVALTNTGALSVTPSITLNAGATLDVSGRTAATGWTLSAAQTLAGSGTVTGAVVNPGNIAFTAGTITPGSGVGNVGKLTFAGALTLDGTANTLTNNFECGTGTNDSIQVNGDLTIASTVFVNISAVSPPIADGTYVLYRWTGNLTGDTNNMAFTLPSQPGVLTVLQDLAAKTISLQVGGAVSANLKWRGDASGDWDLVTTLNWRNAGVASIFNNGDKITFDDTGSNSAPINFAANVTPGSVTFNATKSYIFSTTGSGGLSGSSALVKSNTGSLNIQNSNPLFTGPVTIAGGSLVVGDNVNSTGTLGSGNVTNNATLVFNRPDTITNANLISGSGALVQQGAGMITLNGANNYSGGTTISNGTVQVASYNSSLGSGAVTLAGGTLLIKPTGSATSGFSNNINVTANSTLQYDGTGTFGAVSFAAITGVSGVTLTLTHAAAGPDRLRLYGNFTNAADLNLNGAGLALAPYAATGVQIYNGVISGSGQIVNRGGAVVYLNGANTFTGGVTPTVGTLALGVDSIVTSAPAVDSSPLGTGALNLGIEGAGATASSTLIANGAARTIANPIVYPASSNVYTLIVGGSNNFTFSGAYTLSGADGSGNVNRPLQVDNTAITKFTGVIGDSSLNCGLTKTGSGLLLLDGVNTYAGNTLISAGTFGGSGTIAGNVTNNATLAPGDSALGTLTVNGSLVLNATSTNVFELNAATHTNDLVTGMTSVTYGGTLSLVNLGGTFTNGTVFKLFDAVSYSGSFATLSPATPSGTQVWNTSSLTVDGTISIAAGSVAPVVLTNTALVNGTNLQFSFSGNSGSTYRIWASTNVAATPITNTWTLLTNATFTGTLQTFTDTQIATRPRRFYVLTVP